MDTYNIFDELVGYKYSEVQKISEAQTKIYQLLNEDKENVEALILLMQTHIMLGKRNEAIEVANKIWENIEEVPSSFYSLYLNNLINVGLIEMASTSLKPFFEEVEQAINGFAPLMIKYAGIIGSLNLLNKIKINIPEQDGAYEFASVVEMLKLAEYQDHLREINKIVLSHIKDTMVSCEVLFYDNEEVSEWSIETYVKSDAVSQADLKAKINKEIDEYFNKNELKYWLAPEIEVLSIEEHRALSGDE